MTPVPEDLRMSLLPRLLFIATAACAWMLSSTYARAELTFRWFGVSGFVLSDGKTTLLFDPAVTSTPLSAWAMPWIKVRSDEQEFAYWAQRCGITRLDATVVNHTHTDHAIDAPTAIKKFGGLLVGSSSLKQIGLGQGVPETSIRVLQHRQKLQIGEFTIEAYSTPHPPHLFQIVLADGEITSPLQAGASVWDYHVGQTFSYWITHPEGKILFQAPGRVLSPDVLSELRPDTLLLTIANRISTDSLVEKRVLPSGARQVIPLHWDSFFHPMVREGAPRPLWFQKPEEFRARLPQLAPSVQLDWPEYCRPIPVGARHLFDAQRVKSLPSHSKRDE